MRFILSIILILFTLSAEAFEERNDSIIVQTFVFDSITTRTGDFEFPAYQQWEKVLMHYTLKCDPRTTRDNFDCGEWDYLTYTVVRDSTGQFDSTRISQRNFVIQGSNPNRLEYSNGQTQRNFRISRNNYKIESIESEEILYLGEGTDAGRVDLKNNKYYILYSRSEMNNELVSGIDLNLGSGTSMPAEIIIKMKAVDLDNLDTTYISEDFQELFRTQRVLQAGHNRFYSPNFLRLTSQNSLLFEISVRSAESILIDAEQTSMASAIRVSASGDHLDFNARDYIEVRPEFMNLVENEITIHFWQKGDRTQARNDIVFEGVDTENRRVISSHLPWSNGQVYWDAGNEGGSYDRIQAEIPSQLWKDNWNHWTFTKNVSTGSMKAYCNGELVMEGEGMNRPFNRLSKFKIGSGGNGGNFYDGKIDDFAVYNRELNKDEIQQIIKTGIDDSDDALLFYYDFENITGTIIQDKTGKGFDGNRFGLPAIKRTNAFDAITNPTATNIRPKIGFLKGNYTANQEEELIEYSELEPAASVVIYEHESPNQIIPIEELAQKEQELRTPTDTILVWPTNGWEYTYNEEGNVLDSVQVTTDGTLVLEPIVWFSPIVNYEIDRFITPYGIGLDLGEEGFTWVVDVTDFSPLLHDWVRLSAGNTQELLDLKFIFIKGTPPRDIIDFTTVYSRGTYKYPQIVDNDHLEPRDFLMNPDASMYRVITRSSGHRFGVDGTDNCAEFCNRLHSLWIDDDKKYEWEGWRECGDNPVYPQGGTWLTDRTDWCPGAPVTTYNHEISDFVTPGELATIDYEIENKPQFTTYGDWVFSSYLVSYSEPNFQNDAALYDIISPNIHDEYSRMNPICNNAKIIIRNTGSNDLTSLKITYGIKGYGSAEYIWNGNLKFLEAETVTLPPFSWGDGWTEGSMEFEVTVSEPNGQEDQYANNDYGVSMISATDIMLNDITIELQTNNWNVFGAQSPIHFSLKNDMGDIIFERSSTNNDEFYRDEIQLENGCYEFELVNDFGYGLDFWVLRQQNQAFKSGSVRIRSGSYIKTFEPDFGNSIFYQFRVEDTPEAVFSTNTVDFGYISEGEIVTETLEITPANSSGLQINSLEIPLGDFKGFKIKSTDPEFVEGSTVSLGANDKMLVEIEFEGKRQGIRTATLEIGTNSLSESLSEVELIGRVDVVESVNESAKYFDIAIDQNPINGLANITLSNTTESIRDAKVVLIDALGKEVAVLFEGIVLSNTTFGIDGSSYFSGMYFIQLNSGNSFDVLPIIIE